MRDNDALVYAFRRRSPPPKQRRPAWDVISESLVGIRARRAARAAEAEAEARAAMPDQNEDGGPTPRGES